MISQTFIRVQHSCLQKKLVDEIMAFKKNDHQVMLDKYTESKFCFINIKLTRRISQRHRRALNCKIHETSYKTTIRMKFSGFNLEKRKEKKTYCTLINNANDLKK